jgi:hypothetical protein
MLGAMEGVTTAIVLYIFVCLVFPRLIRHRPQFYAAFGILLFIILLGSWGAMFSAAPTDQAGQVQATGRSPGIVYGLLGLLQIAAIILLALSTSGMTLAEMRADIGKTIEVIRRGGEKETIIVPLRGEMPRSASEATPAAAARPLSAKEPPDMTLPLE